MSRDHRVREYNFKNDDGNRQLGKIEDDTCIFFYTETEKYIYEIMPKGTSKRQDIKFKTHIRTKSDVKNKCINKTLASDKNSSFLEIALIRFLFKNSLIQ